MMKIMKPIHYYLSFGFLFIILLLMATKCNSWNFHTNDSNRNRNHISSDQQCRFQQQQQQQVEMGVTTRRRVLFESIIAAQLLLLPLQLPQAANAYNDEVEGVNSSTLSLPSPSSSSSSSNNGIVTVRLESSRDSLGVEIYDTTLRGKNIVAIRRVVEANKNNKLLREGMILRPNNGGSYSSKELVEKLRSGPYPLEINFLNLAAGGDAISDLGSSIVTPKDALDLAQNTDDDRITAKPKQQQVGGGGGYSVTTIQQTPQQCAIKSRRNDVLEIDYEASYVDAETGKNVIYDASAFRGTGNFPYQMVLGSGDMIPGVDQGLYDMCPGETRLLSIPPILGHGPKSRKSFRIPDNYLKLEWKISLVTIDSTIRQDNNVVSRDERESRFAY